MNPISRARNMSTYSTAALAKQLHVSRQYLSKVEQGLYDKPNDKVLGWSADIISKNSGVPVSAEEIEKLYEEWQWQKRLSSKEALVLEPLKITEYDKVSQPEFRKSGIIYYHKIFVQWRESYWHSYHAFCVDMCLHPSPVADYEEGEMHTMPNALKSVLNKMHLIGEGFRTNER